MTLAYSPRQDDGRPTGWGKAALWLGASLLVVAAHGGAAWMALKQRTAEPSASEPPAAIMIDLAPVAVAPAAVSPDVAPGPKRNDAEASRVDAKPDAPMAAPEPALTDLPRAADAPSPEPPPIAARSPGIANSPLPEIEKAEAVLTPSSPQTLPARPVSKVVVPQKVAPAPPVVAKPKAAQTKIESPKPEPKRVDPAKPSKEEDQAEAHHASAPPKRTARPALAATAPAPSASVNPAAALASWRGELQALINRNKRYPAGASGSGTASVGFAINRSGAVLSAQIRGSSGDPALDAEAVALLRRCSPVPPPPPEIARSVISLTVPIQFTR